MFGALPGGPWPESADSAVLLPIRHIANQKAASGVVVAGVSPRLALDARYREFLDLVAAHISTTLTSAAMCPFVESTNRLRPASSCVVR